MKIFFAHTMTLLYNPRIASIFSLHYTIFTITQTKMFIQDIKITRIFSDKNGDSHFQDVFQPMLYPIGNKQRITKTIENNGVKLFEFAHDFSCNWHLSMQRCYYIYLMGSQEIEVSDGEKRIFQTGDILLAEDTFGRGHRSKSITNTTGRAIIILL